VLLPTLFFLGLVTFERALELGIEDYIYAAGVSRIRHFYVEVVPQAEKYFVGPILDDFASTMAPTVPGAIAVVNGVILGSFTGLLVEAVVAESLALAVGVGVTVFLVSVFLQRRHQVARWQQIEQRLPVLFPSERSS
jgi:tRNA A37 threonylcarbamoyladenosine modification protein TsaB